MRGYFDFFRCCVLRRVRSFLLFVSYCNLIEKQSLASHVARFDNAPVDIFCTQYCSQKLALLGQDQLALAGFTQGVTHAVMLDHHRLPGLQQLAAIDHRRLCDGGGH